MISDLLKILDAIQSSQSAEEKTELESKLRRKVETEIDALFDDFPKRRRTFSSLQESLGIFDPPDKQEELKKILFDMGARPKRGGNDDKYWHLPPKTQSGERAPERKTPWSLIYALILIVILTLTAYSYFAPPDFLSGRTFQSVQDCLDQNNLSMQEISKCFRDYQ